MATMQSSDIAFLIVFIKDQICVYTTQWLLYYYFSIVVTMHKSSFLSTTILSNPKIHNPKLKSSQPNIEIICWMSWQSIFSLRVYVSIRIYYVTFVIVHFFRVFYLPWLFLLKLSLLKLSHIFQWFSLYWVVVKCVLRL